MAISPLAELIIGAGLLGGVRALGTRRQNDRFAESLLNANQLSGLGQGQLQGIAAIAQQDPSLAVQLLHDQQRTMLDRRRLAQNARFQAETLEQGQQRIDISERKETREEELQRLTTQRLAAGAPLTAPGPTQRDVFGQGGQFERRVPIAGTPQFIEAEDRLSQASGAQERINRYRELVSQFLAQPTEQDLGIAAGDLPSGGRNEIAAELEALTGLIALDLKNATGAGALDKGLIDLVDKIIADPTGTTADLRTTASAILAKVEPLRLQTERNLGQALSNVTGFEGLNQAGLQFAGDQLQRGSAITAATGGQLEQVRALREQRRDPDAPLSVRTLERLSELQAFGTQAILDLNPVNLFR